MESLQSPKTKTQQKPGTNQFLLTYLFSTAAANAKPFTLTSVKKPESDLKIIKTDNG